MTHRDAAIIRYALRMLLDRVSHPDRVHHLAADVRANPTHRIGKTEVRRLIAEVQ